MSDKAPRGEYVVRASVLDRLIKNKMEYKFIEYGQKQKDLVEKERIEKRKKAELDKKMEYEEIERQKMLTLSSLDPSNMTT